VKYSEFQVAATSWMEYLNDGLTSLEELRQNALKNERVAKAFAYYCLTGKREFEFFRSLAFEDEAVRQHFADLYYSLRDTTYKHAKSLANELLDRFFDRSSVQLALTLNRSHYAAEYAKYLNELVQEHKLKQEKKSEDQLKYVAERLAKVKAAGLF